MAEIRRSKIERLQAEYRRKKTKLKNQLFQPGFLLIIITPLLLAWYFIGTISSLNRNWELQQRIASENLKEQRLELEIESLQLENQYYASDEYQELAARKLQNKKMPGETMIYLPKNSEAAKNKYTDAAATAAALGEMEAPSNFKQWLMFLFGS